MTLFADLTVETDLLVSVAVPRPLPGFFTYRISAELSSQAKVGGWVRVPFGKSVTHAFIVDEPRPVSEMPEGVSWESLKNVLEVSEPQYALPHDVFALCKWAHEYYFTPLGEVLNGALSAAAVKKKVKARKPKKKASDRPLIRFELNEDQQIAFNELENLRNQGGKVALLNGVTGSGKTEVYIELARKTLAEGRGVIILVPEIALTPQLHQRFENSLGTEVGLWHSAVSQGQRQACFQSLIEGRLKVIVGARSAVFAPVSELGLIVVDEEHDPTYKQEDRFRYQARDLAVVRGKLTQSLVVLGSATPSFETRERVREGRYSQSILRKPIATAGLSQIELVDLLEEEKAEKIQAPLALKTIRVIQETLNAGEQVMIYLNRRGFAAFLLCKDCGAVKNCPHCSISLTVYRRGSELRCHICNHCERIPDFCGKCQSSELYGMGAGTESLETELPQFLQGARICRLDRDQITSATRLNQLLDDFRQKKFNVLLGTQMLVKGHDFPDVTLVVVVMADALFRWPDFRAPERAYQILKQVAGRAGRGNKPGRALIQTFDTSHPVLQVVLGNSSLNDFLETERQLRQALNYPPFGRLARLRFESQTRDEVILRAKSVFQQLTQYENHHLEVMGPSEAFLERAKGIYRWDLMLKSKNIQILQKAIAQSRDHCLQNKWPLLIDIDPYGI